ncbi:hypothetical protein R83H12_01451 [Fibrobacteria bacterium R8-3-H12]
MIPFLKSSAIAEITPEPHIPNTKNLICLYSSIDDMLNAKRFSPNSATHPDAANNPMMRFVGATLAVALNANPN